MKKLLTLLLSLCLCTAFVVPSFAGDLYDYKDLPNYEEYSPTREEMQALREAIRGLTPEELLEYHINKADDNDYIYLEVFLNETADIKEYILNSRLDEVNLEPDDPVWGSIYGLGLNFVLKYGSDVKVHSISKYVAHVKISVKKSIIYELMSDEAVANVYAENGAEPKPLLEWETLTVGDADEDGEVTLKDASVIIKYCAGYEVEINTSNADVTMDGYLNMKDAARLIKDIID